MDVGPPPKPNLSYMNQPHKFHYFEITKNSFMLIKNRENKKLFED